MKKKTEKKQTFIWEQNEKCQKRKCAYFLPKVRGRFFLSPFSFFSSTPFRAIFPQPKIQNVKFQFVFVGSMSTKTPTDVFQLQQNVNVRFII